MIPFTFLINFPLRQVIVFFFGATFFTGALLTFGVGVGLASALVEVANGVAVGLAT